MDDQQNQRRSEAVDAWISGERASESDAIDRMERYRPNKVKRGLAIASVVVGALLLFTTLFGLGDYTDPAREILGGSVLSLMFAVPGLYWFYANSRDSEKIRDWDARRRANESTAQYLNPEERRMLLGAPEPTPLLAKRRWVVVGVVMFAMMVVGGWFLPGAA